MALSRFKIGDLIDSINEKCNISNLTVYEVSGINRDKEFFSPAVQVGRDTSSYKVVPPNCFACNLMHVGRDIVIPISLNRTSKDIIVSPAYSVFRINNTDILMEEYLYMIFKKIDFDRYAAFCTDSSVRDGLEWNRFLEIEIDVPSMEVQQKVVDVYLAMVANQKVYEKGLDDLKLTCDAYIENLRRNSQSENVGKYLTERIEKNTDGKYDNLVGIGKDGFIKPNQVRTTESLRKCNLFYPNDFVYAPSSLVNGVISISKFDEPRICTEEYIVFYSNNPKKLLPEYLLLWTKRSEFGRRIEFNSMDSVRNRYYFQQFQEEIFIPLPDIEVQKDIVEVFKAYEMRMSINNSLKKQINIICPVLIKGSIS
ncbi:MAG: restriction endonuclease subunit S [Bacteroidales bacterium]|nr:restriction endonuclease subunit S [Bacteroidales bacterium]